MKPNRLPGVEPNNEGHISIDAWADRLGISGKAVLNTRETAAILRISERSLRDLIKDGTVPSIRLGRRVLVPVPMLLRSLLTAPEAINTTEN